MCVNPYQPWFQGSTKEPAMWSEARMIGFSGPIVMPALA